MEARLSGTANEAAGAAASRAANDGAGGTETLRTYSDPSVVDQYDRARELLPEERELFARHVKPGQRVFDIGVGAGRTTPFLAEGASRYVGIDYAAPMVERCRERFPNLEFEVADAADLSRWEANSFDVAVFSFNGLGTLPTDEARERCIREVARVLSPSGLFIFSIHNPKYVVFRPVLHDVGLLKGAWRVAYAMTQTVRNAYHRLPSRAFWQGEGFVVDPCQHGALTVYVGSPRHVTRAAERAGFRLVEKVGPDENNPLELVSRPHFYYVFAKG
jgi:ubiquinone/menaquinone biosynthesis C-methylase UbiE